MTKTYLRVTIDLMVYDEHEFRLAAQNRAAQDGDVDPVRFMLVEQTDLSECAQMLLDPGVSPPGSTIDQSMGENVDLCSGD